MKKILQGLARLAGSFVLLRLIVIGLPLYCLLLVMSTDSGHDVWIGMAVVTVVFLVLLAGILLLLFSLIAPKRAEAMLPRFLHGGRKLRIAGLLLLLAIFAQMFSNAWDRQNADMASAITCLPTPARRTVMTREILTQADMKASRATIYWHMALAEGRGFNEGDRIDVSAVDQAEAGNTLAQAAQEGSPEAQYWLGWAYAHGECASRDDRRARYWLTRAHKQGYRPASDALAAIGGNRFTALPMRVVATLRSMF